jgi:putative endonuclease
MYYVYIMSNWNNKVVYIGITNNLKRRVYEHKTGIIEGFTKKYHVHKLVYFDSTTDVYSAITREKQIKGWKRARKNKLVEKKNPNWQDLYQQIL